jgi:hypothetical protein
MTAPDMTEAEYAIVQEALAGLTNAIQSLTARMDTVATGLRARSMPAVPGRPCARSAA